MKVNKTAVVFSIIVSLGMFLFCAPFVHPAAREEFGIGVFILFLILFHIRPKLMGNLHKPDDGEKEEDT